MRTQSTSLTRLRFLKLHEYNLEAQERQSARAPERQRVNNCMDFQLTHWRFEVVLKRFAFSVFNGYFQMESEFSGKVCNFKTHASGYD